MFDKKKIKAFSDAFLYYSKYFTNSYWIKVIRKAIPSIYPKPNEHRRLLWDAKISIKMSFIEEFQSLKLHQSAQELNVSRAHAYINNSPSL